MDPILWRQKIILSHAGHNEERYNCGEEMATIDINQRDGKLRQNRKCVTNDIL